MAEGDVSLWGCLAKVRDPETGMRALLHHVRMHLVNQRA